MDDNPIGTLALIILSFVVYFLPSLIAKARDHHDFNPIFVVNLATGWTVLGWLGTLAWSMTPVQLTERNFILGQDRRARR